MRENYGYGRFRADGRSGADTYSRLYVQENEQPRYGKVLRIKNSSELRSLLDKDKEKFRNSSGEQPRRIRRMEVKDRYDEEIVLVREWETEGPGYKFYFGEEEEEEEYSGGALNFRLFVKAALAVVLAAICAVSLILTAGFRALDNSEIKDDLSVYYNEFKAFSPIAAVRSGNTAVEVSPSAVSGADLSGSDASYTEVVVEEGESDTEPRFASECDVRVLNRKKLSREKELATVFKAGLDSLSSAGLELELYCKIEAGTESIEPSVFAENRNTKIEFVQNPTRAQLDTVGCHVLRVRAEGKERNVLLIVEDTVAPEVSVTDIDIWLGDTVGAEAFVSKAKEISPLVVGYTASAPNFSQVGQQVVYLDVKDISGNSCEMQTALLNITEDTEPPVISGAKNRNVVIGESVSYKDGVTALDNRDGEIRIKVDSSKVNPTKTGVYEVTYTAVDRAGNTTTKTVTFRFGTAAELDTDVELDKYVQKVAKKIFKSGMTDAQKIKKIYDWCRANIGYSGHSDKGSWKKAAIAGFKKHSGDCFTYFACSKALFEYCGIENIDVVKVRLKDSESRHYWSLVDVGTGYYHFDATPRVGGFNGFMRTDEQLKSYSKNHKNCHRFDESLYPATPKTKYGS